jgi:hypothetical protein
VAESHRDVAGESSDEPIIPVWLVLGQSVLSRVRAFRLFSGYCAFALSKSELPQLNAVLFDDLRCDTQSISPDSAKSKSSSSFVQLPLSSSCMKPPDYCAEPKAATDRRVSTVC